MTSFWTENCSNSNLRLLQRLIQNSSPCYWNQTGRCQPWFFTPALDTTTWRNQSAALRYSVSAEYQNSVLYTMVTKFAHVPSCPYSAPSSTSSFRKEKWRNRWVHSLKHTHRFKHFPWPEWEVKTVLKNLYYVGMELNLPWVLLHLCETDLCNHLPLNQNTTQQSCDYTISDDR